MRRLVFTSLLAGVAFGVGMSVLFVPLFYLAGQIQNGINLSAVTGALFGLAIGWFSYSTEKKFRTRGVHLHPGETLVHQGPANHFVGRESVGGWLCITNQRLFFESHKLNNFVHGWDAPLTEVTGVSLCSTLKVIPNGVRVATTQGTRQFVVANRNEWKQKIECARRGLPNPSIELTCPGKPGHAAHVKR